MHGRVTDREDRLKIRKFLMGLSDDFRQIRSTILSMEKLPNFGKVYSMVIHEESQQQLSEHTNNHQASVFYSARNPNANKSLNNNNNASSSQAPKPSYAPAHPNAKKRPPTPTEPLYYKSGKKVNTRYYCFHYASFGHSDEKCSIQHGYPSSKGTSFTRKSNPAATPTTDTNKPKGSTNCVSTEEDWFAWDKGKKKIEDSDNPIGPHGFPLYSEKYNHKTLPKYKNPGTTN